MELNIPGIVNFDVFDNQYFLIYRENNIIEVYSIDMYIYLSYRMRLPLYKTYENYAFKVGFNQHYTVKNLIRTYRNDMLFLMMED